MTCLVKYAVTDRLVKYMSFSHSQNYDTTSRKLLQFLVYEDKLI